MSPQDEVVIFAQEKRNVRYPEGILNELADAAQQLFQIKHGGGLLGNCIDGLQLPLQIALQAGGLVGNGCVGEYHSPGTSPLGTGRSSMGQMGVPVSRLKT